MSAPLCAGTAPLPYLPRPRPRPRVVQGTDGSSLLNGGWPDKAAAAARNKRRVRPQLSVLVLWLGGPYNSFTQGQ